MERYETLKWLLLTEPLISFNALFFKNLLKLKTVSPHKKALTGKQRVAPWRRLLKSEQQGHGRSFRTLNVPDGELFVRHGAPEHIRSDYGPEFIAIALREWLSNIGVKTLYITPASPWENGYCESFNSKLRDELLAREIFYELREAKALIEGWRYH